MATDPGSLIDSVCDITMGRSLFVFFSKLRVSSLVKKRGKALIVGGKLCFFFSVSI